MAQRPIQRSREDELRDICGKLIRRLQLEKECLEGADKDGPDLTVILAGGGHEVDGAWATIELAAKLVNAQDLIGAIKPLIQERSTMRHECHALHQHYKLFRDTFEGDARPTKQGWETDQSISREVWDEFIGQVETGQSSFGKWLGVKRKQASGELAQSLNLLVQTIDQIIHCIGLWLLPSTEEGYEVPNSGTDIKAGLEIPAGQFSGSSQAAERDATSEGEWVGPMSKSEIARRCTDDPDARWRKIAPLFPEGYVRAISPRTFRFRIDQFDLPTQKRCREG